MGMFSVFDIAGSGMSAQTVRLNTTASNLSNADTPAASAEAAYKAKQPIFSAVQGQVNAAFSEKSGVQVDDVITSQDPARRQYQPGHALADKDGYIYLSNVNVMEEMANMISASRSYQMNVNVMNTAKQLMLRTLQLGQ